MLTESERYPPRIFRRMCAAILLVAAITPAHAQRQEYSLVLSEQASRAALSYAVPDTDIVKLTFTCDDGGILMSYDAATAQSAAFGTKQATSVDVRIGAFHRTIAAIATWGEIGSPSISARIKDRATWLRALLSGREIVTRDKWGRMSIGAPSRRLIAQFDRSCR